MQAVDVRVPTRAADLYELTKPRIALLVLVTTVGAMVWAADGVPPLGILVATVVGMSLLSGGAGALNHLLDRDVDRLMRRTSSRPIAAGRLSPEIGAAAGMALIIVGTAVMWAGTNPVATALGVCGAFFYVVIYTAYLKRRTPQNIVIGGAAGAIPPLAGWAAVTGEIALAPVVMFLIIFLWTPPHFWALALMAKEDYRAAGIPMLPVVVGDERTARQILVYTVVLTIVSIAPVAVGLLGLPYLIAAALLGARFIQLGVRLLRDQSRPVARAMFLYSLVYLALIFAAMGLDRALVA